MWKPKNDDVVWSIFVEGGSGKLEVDDWLFDKESNLKVGLADFPTKKQATEALRRVKKTLKEYRSEL